VISSSSRCETLRYSRTGELDILSHAQRGNRAPLLEQDPPTSFDTPSRLASLRRDRFRTPRCALNLRHQSDEVRVSTDLPAPKTDEAQNFAALDVEI